MHLPSLIKLICKPEKQNAQKYFSTSPDCTLISQTCNLIWYVRLYVIGDGIYFLLIVLMLTIHLI